MADDASIQNLFERLALEAGRIILEVRDSGFSVISKQDDTPVTDADVRAEAIIRDGLRNELSQLPLVAEEEVSCGRIPGALGDAFLLVDALDGTREFVAGREDFTVNIALVRLGIPTIGVVFAPAKKVLFSGRAGLAEKIEVGEDCQPIGRHKISVSEPYQPMRIVASRSHRTAETDAFIARYPGASIVPIGSSLKFCHLAAGEADLYPRFGRTMEWDTAAGDAILRAAGGETRRIEGSPLEYGKRGQINDVDFANPWFVAGTIRNGYSASG